MPAYAHRKTVPYPFAQALERTRAALAAQGFGVPVEMDTQAIFMAKLGKASPRRVILGACLPQVAFQALEAEPEIAVLLPCNVVVTEQPGGALVTTIAAQELFRLTRQVDPAHAGVVDQKLLAALAAI